MMHLGCYDVERLTFDGKVVGIPGKGTDCTSARILSLDEQGGIGEGDRDKEEGRNKADRK